ncbi:MAG: S9 family peptidase [Bacteroidales bacterium]|nr:S9 family peptidase [Bacteroidales bacterium]
MKKYIHLSLIVVVAIFISACSEKEEKSEATPENPVNQVKLESDIMTPEALWSFGRIGGVHVSPDQEQILFRATFYDTEKNKGNGEIFITPVEGNEINNITQTETTEFNARWRPDGEKIGYLSSRSGSTQLWEMTPDGSDKKQISDIKGGINGFEYAPNQEKILYIKEVKLDKNVHDIHPDLPKANARIETDLMYRHWDEWHNYKYSHVFVADYNGSEVTNSVDIMEGEKYHAPLEPFGGMEQVNWSPDSKEITYTCKKLTGKEYTLSTDSEIYIYDLESGETENLTQEKHEGYDKAAVYSPNGEMIAWGSMRRDGYESDKNRIFVYNFNTGKETNYSTDFEQNANGLTWSADSKKLYFTSDYHARFQIYELNLENEKIRQVTEGRHNYRSVEPAGDILIGSKQSMSQPTEIYSIDPATGGETQVSFINKNLMDQLTMGKVEKRWIETTDGKEMLTWVIYPPHFDKEKQYPTLLYCQGGPQASVSQFFSYRWNFQMMAANGYIVVAPNRRGLPSFGMDWLEQISGDYAGQNIRDYLSAIDAVKKEPYVDHNNLGAVGASYGGYSVFYLAGHHEGRFDAFISHDGMFNMESFYLQTEEMWFPNWDLGGPYWEEENQEVYEQSPHRFVDEWDTPIMVIHGEKDYRIPYTQGMSAFNAAQLQDIPSKFLFFPNENHWVLKPQNGILWQREFFKWLDKWLKK